MGETTCYFLSSLCTSQYIIGVYLLQLLLCFSIAIAILKLLLAMKLQQRGTWHRLHNSPREQERVLLPFGAHTKYQTILTHVMGERKMAFQGSLCGNEGKVREPRGLTAQKLNYVQFPFNHLYAGMKWAMVESTLNLEETLFLRVWPVRTPLVTFS